MSGPVFVLGVSAVLTVAGLVVMPELLFLALICGLGGVILALFARPSASRGPLEYVLLDGSNIMHWHNGEPDINVLRGVIAEAAARGLTPAVVFDANAGYKLAGQYLDHHALAWQLDLPSDQVMVVNRGEVADGMILRAARDHGARVISNDRFRDWAEQFPEVATPGFLIAGRIRDGALELDVA